MNARQIEHQEIWKQVKGSEKLFEIYNYFPTLHDAKIIKINLNFENREFYLTVDYSDLTDNSDKSGKTRFTICWRNVIKANFKWYAEDLYGMKFSKEGEFIKTKFTDYSFGFDGEVIANEIEIVDIETDKEKMISTASIKFEIS